MLLGLSKIIDCPGASLPFNVSVDLSDLCYGVSYPVTEPVVASGTVRNTAGVLMMEGDLTTTIHALCDRCASPFDREIHFPIDVVLVTELALELGSAKVLNIIMLGVYVGCTEVIAPQIVWETVAHKLSGKAALLPLNERAFQMGLELGKAQR